ncbi:DUF2917 domain-containing protein [uncultured Azohydromonas sp.]|jgi:Protein of unknown function (DUF2917).|uniref:DUF2917 domain-containing protein n=1 Tax=uncultured Azohydromonas sp. TaxID=487342 RepID=UPI0026255087|nr:DUF2917 domain-containing protein [uncultured Azohydromonas sp.]
MSPFQAAGTPAWPRLFSAAGAAVPFEPVRAVLRRAVAGRGTPSLEVGFCCRARLALARREWVVLSQVRRQTLVCEAGELWVTLDGEGEDHVLRPGERLVVAANASVIVSATREAVLRVVASAPEGRMARGLLVPLPVTGRA